MSSVLHASSQGNFTRRLGISLLMLMPLVSLTNVWKFAELDTISIRGVDLLFLLICYILVQDIFLYGRIRRGVLIFLGSTLIFFLISLLGSVILSNYQVNWPALLRFIQTLLWGGFALSFVSSERDFKNITRNVIIAGVVLSLFSVYLYLTKPSLHRIAGYFSATGGEGLGRQASFNEIGALYALAAVLALNYLFCCNKKCKRWGSIMMTGGFLSNTLGLVLVQSRSALLAFIVGSFASFIPHLNIRRFLTAGRISQKAIIFSSAILAVVLFTLISSRHLVPVDRIWRTFIPGSSEYMSALARPVLWHKAIWVWVDEVPYFLLGYGFRSTQCLIGAETTENFFLNIGLWLGVIGLVPVLILLIWPVFKVKKSPKRSMAVGTAIGATSVALIVSIFGNTLVDPFYGGCTFLILYGSLAASSFSRESPKCAAK